MQIEQRDQDKDSSMLVDRAEVSLRASTPLSSVPRPFLRWAGSKRLVLSHIAPYLPPSYNTYFEPFLGSAALFFLLRPRAAVLSDACRALVETYAGVRTGPSRVLRHLASLAPGKEAYYHVRENMSRGHFRRAAQFIYLNRMCWNGLYRVNSAGKFNVPYGLPKSDAIVDAANLLACGRLLRRKGVLLQVADFEVAASSATKGDLVFLDPPYVTGHRNNGFVDYNGVLFSWEDQVRLARFASLLRSKGCHVLLTNADHESISALYPDFCQVRFDRKSTIASHPGRRGRTTELLIVGKA